MNEKNKKKQKEPYTNSKFDTIEYDASKYKNNTFEKMDYIKDKTAMNSSIKNDLVGKINRKEAKVGIVGLGYVGLPLAVTIAEAGFATIGIDTDSEVVTDINLGKPSISEINPQVLERLLKSNKFKAFTDYAKLADVDCIIICVPTPLTKTKEPDITLITSAVSSIIPHLNSPKLIILESTAYPGTTCELVSGEIEKKTELKTGRNVFVAFSPERVDPGNKKWNIKNTPKIIGGITKQCSLVTSALYSAVIDKVHVVKNAKEAEMIKLLENTFRAVNIGLVNEFMLMCERMNIDIWNVIDAASTKPFGFMPFFPGPGIGGHCIPLDPMYLSWKARSVDFYNRFIEIATDINGNMPRFVVSKLTDMLNNESCSLKGSKIMVIGMAYKKNVNDIRESPGLEIYRLLREKGAWVEYHDPHIPYFKSMLGNKIKSSSIDEDMLGNFNAAVLITDHDSFDYAHIAQKSPMILDCRNAFFRHGITKDHIIKL